MPVVEVRCPVGMRRLFMKMKLAGETPTITENNLMEFACADCKRSYVRQGDPVERVLHRYDFLGGFVETEKVYRDM